ncbi:MAG TPA: tetratricopeptide repeat protein, partial [Anaeromyxobacteraceae bacterium]|nr:tetratricopeptide repeat protein [Anaeromyxobacteraceae bacterium]
MTGDLQPAPLQVDEPLPLGPDDAVPLLRADLVVQRGKSPGLFQVADPASGRAFTLYEFELSIARMLDGRRRAAELVEAGARLGIPVDLAGLHKFVRQLWHYGFLAPAGAEPAAPPEGGGREAWDEATRALFQTGLRLVHLGRPKDAAAYFEAILDGHPGHPEATELLAAIAQGRTIPATPIGDGGERVPVDAAAPPATTAGAAGSPRPRRALALAI